MMDAIGRLLDLLAAFWLMSFAASLTFGWAVMEPRIILYVMAARYAAQQAFDKNDM